MDYRSSYARGTIVRMAARFCTAAAGRYARR
jgi:hypothetical protein